MQLRDEKCTRAKVGQSVVAIALLSLALLAASEPASQQEPALVWEAPETCPDERTIRARVEQLIGRTLADDETVRVHARVEIAERPSVVLRVDSASGSSERTITAVSCAELGEIAAVVIAIAIDPAASLRAEAEPEPAPPPKPQPPPPPPPREERAPAAVAKPRPIAHRGPMGTLRVAAGVSLGAVPGVTAAIEAGGGVRWKHARIDLSAEHWLSQRAEAAGSNAAAIDVRLTIARAQGCWVPTAGRIVELPLCGGAAVGAAYARGSGVPQSRPHRVAWAAAHVQAAVVLAPIRRFAIGPFARLQIPILRPAFSLDGYGVVHRTAKAGFVGGVSIEVRFP